MKNQSTFLSELKKLNIRDRNRVRSIASVNEEEKAVKLINQARQRLTWKEILQMERALRFSPSSGRIPDLFPGAPQTNEDYFRLIPIKIDSQLRILNSLVSENLKKLTLFGELLRKLNLSIIESDFVKADELLLRTTTECGYSHALMRKAALLKALAPAEKLTSVDAFLQNAGLEKSNIISTSVVHCYQDESDFLTLKRSILNLGGKGGSNRFTRDISRLTFHPHAKNLSDLESLLQSSYQSSLIDACFTIKINQELLEHPERLGSETKQFFALLERASPTLDEIAGLSNGENAEELYIKRSSAWFENDLIVKCRFALDHFNDSPDSRYLEINEKALDRAGLWLKNATPRELMQHSSPALHNSLLLEAIEMKGAYTRSAAFNYGLWRTEGYIQMVEQEFFDLMGQTRDLAKTSPASYLRNLANSNGSETVKLIAYLLVAKRSRSERDDHKLRNVIQTLAINNHDGNLVKLIASIAERSSAVAEYAYEVCTEDFIAKLSRIIRSAAQITETRAALHQWMGERTGRKVYLDRARTILIDRQINKIRNEIDDNRIYVDAGRFSEWINDEIVAELNALIVPLQKNLQTGAIDALQVIGLISRCYSTFCQNQVFGIASYLGRRIRHGTFKGHLYYSVIAALESRPEYEALQNEPVFLAKWGAWKKQFEGRVDSIIRERLHVESNTKKQGFLRTDIEAADKYEIALGCAKNVVKDYLITNSTSTAAEVLLDYCWMLAEVDLKSFNSWLKGQKNSLLDSPQLDELKSAVPTWQKPSVSGLQRETIRAVTEKLNNMSTWFKRPPSASPKASLSLLFQAVVAEVQETFPNFRPNIEDNGTEFELFGGAYHILYDSFYVAVFNAAKHGKEKGPLYREFHIEPNEVGGKTIVCQIKSELKDEDSEVDVAAKLEVAPHELDDISNAQVIEGRSGIRKLYQLGLADRRFSIKEISCIDRHVALAFAYSLR